MHICASFFNELCDCLRNLHCLIARNVCMLFSSNRGVSQLNKACYINELSRGSVPGPKILINNQ